MSEWLERENENRVEKQQADQWSLILFPVVSFSRKTQWYDPRDKQTKPATVSDCVGDELPYGWEVAIAPKVGLYYIDHINRKNQLEDPREECRNMQIQMLESYLRQAESLDPINTSSVSLATSSQYRQSLERLNSSFLNLDVSTDLWNPGMGSPQQQLPPHHLLQNSDQQHMSPSSGDRPTVRDRQTLLQSLQDSKSRVAQLKRELDTNARLLTLIEKYKTRDDEFAVEVWCHCLADFENVTFLTLELGLLFMRKENMLFKLINCIQSWNFDAESILLKQVTHVCKGFVCDMSSQSSQASRNSWTSLLNSAAFVCCRLWPANGK